MYTYEFYFAINPNIICKFKKSLIKIVNTPIKIKLNIYIFTIHPVFQSTNYLFPIIFQI